MEVLSIKRQISEVLSIKSSIFFRNITVKELKWFKHFRLMVKLENMDNVTKQGNIYKYDLYTILHYYEYDLHTILQYITSVFYFLFTILFASLSLKSKHILPNWKLSESINISKRLLWGPIKLGLISKWLYKWLALCYHLNGIQKAFL